MYPAPVIILGMGEMGGVFARAFLRSGYPVYPLTRQMDAAAVARTLPQPNLVIVAVGEADLQPVLEQLPPAWRERLLLLQNELLPADWRRHDLAPTVMSVWFEKKPGQDAKVIVPSPVFGPHAEQVASALQRIGIACEVLSDATRLLFELVRKNLYILTSNIAGLAVDGTVGELWEKHRELAATVCRDVLSIQERLSAQSLPAEPLQAAMLLAFDGDPAHKCKGRSAPARLRRALAQADEFGLAVPTLRKIAAESL